MSNTLPAILLLEADAATQELYRRELSRHFQVYTCRDENEALQRLRTADIRAVVLEPEWAGGQGWHFLTALNQASERPRVPIIICSVLDERRTGYQLGVAAYCVKPVPPTILLTALRQALASEPEMSVERR
jgi:DNA-binding response OmpR family regulator